MKESNYAYARLCALGATCLALNVGLAKVSNLLSLPFTFDTVGTILGAALLPLWAALMVAALSSVAGSLIIHPAFLFYVGTQIVICLAAWLAVRRLWFSGPWRAVLSGLAIGVLSAAVSSPVTAIVFQGVSVPSITALNVVFLTAGQSLWKSVLSGSLIVESIDKSVAGLMVWLILGRLPQHMTSQEPAP